MKFTIWNVNSIRTRVDRVIAFPGCPEIDVLAVQEIKRTSEQFPIEPFTAAGYEVAIHGLNQWNGVVITSRLPIVKVRDHSVDQPGFGELKVVEACALGAVLRGENEKETCIWSLYASNRRELDHPHHAYRLDWLRKLRSDAQSWLVVDPKACTVMVSDWNIAPFDGDVWDVSAFDGATHASEPERQVFFAFAEDGWAKVTRDRATNYTFWDYRRLCPPKSEGTCIDFVYASLALAPSVSVVQIGRNERKGRGASNHALVVITLKDRPRSEGYDC